MGLADRRHLVVTCHKHEFSHVSEMVTKSRALGVMPDPIGEFYDFSVTARYRVDESVGSNEAAIAKLVIEVKTADAALAVAVAGFDVIQAEKFSPAEIAALVERMASMAYTLARLTSGSTRQSSQRISPRSPPRPASMGCWSTATLARISCCRSLKNGAWWSWRSSTLRRAA
ncbi:hypothetical protein [Bradyrhizobium genosp. SA-3]|uniref:hypothetical protein n=1 Tax=Bradyrhizobium genosp. SA-3 TaxID=508868 RepID=UPI003D9BDDAA